MDSTIDSNGIVNCGGGNPPIDYIITAKLKNDPTIFDTLTINDVDGV